jgi:membrane-associated protease RseP (regulator of RpoE activity)
MRPLESWPAPIPEPPAMEVPVRVLDSERRLPLLNVVLFAATMVTTTIAGAVNEGIPLEELGSHWKAGLPFSITLMAILLAHEMGHYLVARHYGVHVTPPYFLPGPPFLTGTFGAFIRMKSPPSSRRVLFDIGAAGPWAGLCIAVPAVVVGLWRSELRPIPPTFGGMEFGDSLLFKMLSRAVFGRIPHGFDIILDPVALAGWFGFFVTLLNLLPVGQLDGGHVVYAMFGKHHRWIARSFLVLTVGVGFLGWMGWFLWAALMLFVGVDHPRTLDHDTALDPLRRFAGWMTLVVLAVTFIPVPIAPSEGGSGPSPDELIAAIVWFLGS